MAKPILQNLWFVRLMTALLWALLAASAVSWFFKLGSPLHSGAAPVAAAPPLVLNAQSMPFLLGQRQVAVAPAPAQTQSDYQLVGVLAGTRSQQGAALIAVNGKPARTYTVGATVEGADGFVLQSLQGREARLGASLDGDAARVLEMPEFKVGAAVAAPFGSQPVANTVSSGVANARSGVMPPPPRPEP